jgi:putative peptide zinc metalloprotease protein
VSDASAQPRATLTVPPLRQDLELIVTEPDINGARRWLIYDPLQHKFVAIGPGTYALLQVWSDNKTIEQLVNDAWEHHAETLAPQDVAQFIQYLQSCRLTLDAPGGGWRSLAAFAAKSKPSLASHLLHTYLFFRVPLLQPERFLRATLFFVRPFGTRSFAILMTVLGAVGLYLVSREWDEFRATFAGVATFEGAAFLGCALMVVKLVHELGHAYAATSLGCRVPVLGVAFILGAPLLYCDVTDTWRLKSSWARFRVDVAGILADLSVACLATFLWAFLPPGFVKHFMFSLATAGWVLSLTMNLNPFMKFDGYHIASDILGIENMQDRAMAIGRWRMREILFALNAAPPERVSPGLATGLSIYAWALWIYRLVVFTGIAIVVYHFFFKLAGLVLFTVEIGYFLIAPMMRELSEWWTMRQKILSSGRSVATLVVLGMVVAFLTLPLSTHVRMPAVLTVPQLTGLYTPVPARVAKIHVGHGDKVEAGAALVALVSNDLIQELELNRLKTEVVSLRLDRGTGDSDDRSETVVLENEKAALQQQADGLIRQRNELEISAPFAGVVAAMLPALHVDRTLSPREAVLVLRGRRGGEARGAVDEGDMWRLKTGVAAVFVPNDTSLPHINMEVRSISQSAMATISPPELAASQGGRIADRQDARRQPIPVTAQYSVTANSDGDLPDTFQNHSTAGVIVAVGAPESVLSSAWRQILKVLVRESGL